MLPWLAAVLTALVLAAVHYARRDARGGLLAATLPAALRALGILLLVAALLDAPAGRLRAPAPFAAVDASASWRRGGDQAGWRTALDRARAAGADSLFLFGDSLRAGAPPGEPADVASRARPAVDRALAAGRALVLVTDGEVDDPDALAGLPAGSRVDVVARPARRDAAVLSLDVPRAIVAGDTLEARITVAADSLGTAPGTLTLDAGGRRLASAALDALPPFGERAVTLRAPLSASDGAVVVTAVAAAPGDAEPRNDSLSAVIEVSPAAGAVFVSTKPDFDSRYALDVLRGTLALPTRGYFLVAPGQWRVEGSLAPVADAEVRRAAREAPLVILHGDTAALGSPRANTRGALALVAPPAEQGDWYATGAPASPMSASLSAIPWDSLPPIDVAAQMPAGSWEGLETRRARRLDRRVAITGVERPRRIVVVGAAGLWRWRFRGGVSADAFTAVWGSIFDWLAGERSDVRAAFPADASLRAGEPVRWRRGASADSVVRVAVTRRGGTAGVDSMTLRWPGGASIAESAPLAPGIYDVRVAGGGAVLAVNASREWLPRRPSVRAGSVGGGIAQGAARGLRVFAWPYALALLALCGEWLLRRRLGLR